MKNFTENPPISYKNTLFLKTQLPSNAPDWLNIREAMCLGTIRKEMR
jgi:hypothetical protein